jgi:DNA-directed RNA polymerase specialized sigma24 family protein
MCRTVVTFGRRFSSGNWTAPSTPRERSPRPSRALCVLNLGSPEGSPLLLQHLLISGQPRYRFVTLAALRACGNTLPVHLLVRHPYGMVGGKGLTALSLESPQAVSTHGRRHMTDVSGTISPLEYALAYSSGHRRTVNFLMSRGLPEDEAAEKAQAAWARGWERRDQIRDKSRTLTWVNAIALNLYRSQARRDARRCEFTDYAVPPQASPTAMDVHRILKKCRPNDRQILTEHYLVGHGIRELALKHGCTETAVRVRLLRARRRMLEWLGVSNLRRENSGGPVG